MSRASNDYQSTQVRTTVTVEDKTYITEPWPSGHYYSPIPDYDWIGANPGSLRTDPNRSSLPGIDLNLERQLQTVREIKRLVPSSRSCRRMSLSTSTTSTGPSNIPSRGLRSAGHGTRRTSSALSCRTTTGSRFSSSPTICHASTQMCLPGSLSSRHSQAVPSG